MKNITTHSFTLSCITFLIALLGITFLSITSLAQNTSPLKVVEFRMIPGGIMDELRLEKNQRTDYDDNPVCEIKVKAQGFDEEVMQRFKFSANGPYITKVEFDAKNEWRIYLSSKRRGSLTIKYQGDCVFDFPAALEPKKIYELTLGMETATLNIITTPDNATIYIDDEKVGVGHGSKAVSIGAEHKYRVECDDYITEENTVTFTQSEKKELNIDLRPDFGYITVKSTPSGAEVYIDEKKAGTTPHQMKKIKRGQHVVELRMTGYEPFADMVTIKAGEVNRQLENVTLEAVRVLYGKVYVVSSPSGADITIDNDYKGKTPMTVENVPVGSRNVTLTYGDYAPAIKMVLVEDGKTASVNVTLTNGREISISTDRNGDEIYADGNYLGASPLTAALSFGVHTIKAVRDSKSVEKTITVAQTGGDSSVRLTFEKENKTFTVNGVTFEMVAVKGGTFTMGGTSEQGSDAESDETTHSVTLSDYYIGKFEVTQELWEAVMGSNPSRFKGSKLPVEQVSWDDCQDFITELNRLTGANFRLPTEAEWEYAARAGSDKSLYGGENIIVNGKNDSPNLDRYGWYGGNCGRNYTVSDGCDVTKGYDISGWDDKQYSDRTGGTHPVGRKVPNAWGIYDMLGNVCEWCQDWYGSYGSGSQTNPQGPSSGSNRVSRGGSWSTDARRCRVSNRDYRTPDTRHCYLGFRLVVSQTVAQTGGDSSVRLTFEKENKTFTVNGVTFEMVAVKGGTFTMGATSEQGGDAYDFEEPTHSVTLGDYYIGKFEVTQELWEAVMGSNPSSFKGSKLPVEQVSWDDCQTFIRKLNQLTGANFRLPTEAEWEYAARGGSKSGGYKYSGSNNINDVAWYTVNSYDKGSSSPDYGTHAVGTKSPNELGIYDMSGNVWEWCQDWYGNYGSGSQTNPQGPSSGSYRVFRGGSWHNSAGGCCVSFHDGMTPDVRRSSIGFRLVVSQTVAQTGGDNAVRLTFELENKTFTVNGVTFEMVGVKGGTFTMGGTPEQGGDAYDWEKPAHSVTLSDYYIGKFEVTQELWEAVMGSNPSRFKGSNLPVEKVSWDDCQEFIRKLNGLTGKNFRLPTEAEWEYAARGGNKSRGYKYSGSNNINDVAWFWENSGDRTLTGDWDYGRIKNNNCKTHAVGTKSPNELGIYDMSGNVSEWCQDWDGSYSSGSQTNPQGPSSGSDRVHRGGIWFDLAQFCRVAYRNNIAPGRRRDFLGFRLAVSQ